MRTFGKSTEVNPFRISHRALLSDTHLKSLIISAMKKHEIFAIKKKRYIFDIFFTCGKRRETAGPLALSKLGKDTARKHFIVYFPKIVFFLTWWNKGIVDLKPGQPSSVWGTPGSQVAPQDSLWMVTLYSLLSVAVTNMKQQTKFWVQAGGVCNATYVWNFSGQTRRTQFSAQSRKANPTPKKVIFCTILFVLEKLLLSKPNSNVIP